MTDFSRRTKQGDSPQIVFGLQWPGWRWFAARVVRGEWRYALVGLYARHLERNSDRG